MTDTVLHTVEDRVAWVRFNRPRKRNCMSPTLNREMMAVLDALEFRDDVGVLVLSGEGSAWSAGMDLKEYFRETEERGLGAVRRAQREAYGWWRRLRWYQKPTIAMVNGWCFGGGYGPLFACDLAFAAEEARFGLSEINWGILPGGGATKVVVDLLPMRDAMYHALTGEMIDGATAARWRLVNEAVPLSALRGRVKEVARVLLDKSPVALKAAKDAIRRVKEMTYDNAEDYLVRAQEAANFFDDATRHDGIRKFIDDKAYKPGLGTFPQARTDCVARHATERGDRLAVVDLESGRRFSYTQLDRCIASGVTLLSSRGVTAGDRVAALLKNDVAAIVLHFACARLGAIYAPLNTRLTDHELTGLCSDIQPRLCIIDERVASALPADLTLSALWDALDTAPPAPRGAIDPTRPSLLLFTSGTTSRPKGALLSERNLDETAINFSELGRVSERSVFLCDAPMFHIIGLVASIRPALRQGGVCLVSTGFVPSVTLARLGDATLGVTHYFCVPQMAAALRGEPTYQPSALFGLTALFTGGAPHAAEAVRTFAREGVLVADGYGMTEVGTVFGMPPDLAVITRRAGTVGKSTARVATRIVDDAGRDCPDGTPGELLVRGDNVFVGYFERPSDTAAAFVDGWFRTGDVAVRDADGFHRIIDRKKDMFISGGENVYPAEIEASLADFPGLREVAVVGVPDPHWGEVGHLFYVPRDAEAPSVEALLEHMSARLARYKLPKHFSALGVLPRTAAGKLRKDLLRAHAINGERAPA